MLKSETSGDDIFYSVCAFYHSLCGRPLVLPLVVQKHLGI